MPPFFIIDGHFAVVTHFGDAELQKMALNAEMQEMPSFSASSSEKSCKNAATTDVLLYCLNFFKNYTVLNTFSFKHLLSIQIIIEAEDSN